MLEVVVRTPLHPSEDPAKVRRAILNIFPGADLEDKPGFLVGRTDSLLELRGLIRKQKILDAARRSLLRSLSDTGDGAAFRLNKQGAFRGRVSFAEDLQAPLGDLVVTVTGDDLEALFKEMAPMTIRGIPVSEERAEQEMAKRRAQKRQAPALYLDQELAPEEEPLEAATAEPEAKDEP